MVPNMHKSTLTNFDHLNCSFSSANENKNVNRLDELLKIVFDCKTATQRKIRLSIYISRTIKQPPDVDSLSKSRRK